MLILYVAMGAVLLGGGTIWLTEMAIERANRRF